MISGPLTSCAVRPVSHCRLGRGPGHNCEWRNSKHANRERDFIKASAYLYMKAPSRDQVVPPGLPGSRLMPADDVAAVPRLHRAVRLRR